MFNEHFTGYVYDGCRLTIEAEGFTCHATLYSDDDATPPDQRCDGFWPSLDPDDAGYIGAKSKRTLARHRAQAQAVMDGWRNGDWAYYGVAVTVEKNGVALTGKYAHALWGIEGNYPSRAGNRYFTEVANDLLADAIADARAKIATLCAA